MQEIQPFEENLQNKYFNPLWAKQGAQTNTPNFNSTGCLAEQLAQKHADQVENKKKMNRLMTTEDS